MSNFPINTVITLILIIALIIALKRIVSFFLKKANKPRK